MLDKLVAQGGDPAAIVASEGLGAMEDSGELDGAIDSALAANPDIAERLRSGDMKPMGVIIGHVMRETKGRADGGEVTRLVRSGEAGSLRRTIGARRPTSRRPACRSSSAWTSTGHTTLAEWTTDDPASVEAAVEAFREELDRGYFAMVTDRRGPRRAGPELPVDARHS